jgi:hypothetical protein
MNAGVRYRPSDYSTVRANMPSVALSAVPAITGKLATLPRLPASTYRRRNVRLYVDWAARSRDAQQRNRLR